MMINCYTRYALSRLEKTPALRPAFYNKRSELTRSFLKDLTFLYDWTPFLQVRAKNTRFLCTLIEVAETSGRFLKNTARFS